MRALYMQISGLIGLLIFVREAWSYAPLDRALFLGISIGMVVYLLLFVGHTLVRQILAYTPPESDASSADADDTTEANASSADTDDAAADATADNSSESASDDNVNGQQPAAASDELTQTAA